MRISIIFILAFFISSCNPSPPVSPNPEPREFTYNEFEQIEVGMTLVEAETAMGASAAKISQIETDLGLGVVPVKNVTYQWVNDDGSSVTVLEQNGEIIFKMQTGLDKSRSQR
jgi:PBP1b-binding outer membrane lipoprotein LpoB